MLVCICFLNQLQPPLRRNLLVKVEVGIGDIHVTTSAFLTACSVLKTPAAGVRLALSQSKATFIVKYMAFSGMLTAFMFSVSSVWR